MHSRAAPWFCSSRVRCRAARCDSGPPAAVAARAYDHGMASLRWRVLAWVLGVVGALLVVGVLIAKLIALLVPIALIAIVLLVIVPMEVRRARNKKDA